jgi:Tfp pilus assembly protein PilN
MSNRFKITVYDSPIVSEPGAPSRLAPRSRFKLMLLGIVVALLAFGALAVALLVGWVIAAVLGSILILGTLVVFLKAAFRSK